MPDRQLKQHWKAGNQQAVHVSLVWLERNSLKWSSALLTVLRIERSDMSGFIGFQKIQGFSLWVLVLKFKYSDRILEIQTG